MKFLLLDLAANRIDTPVPSRRSFPDFHHILWSENASPRKESPSQTKAIQGQGKIWKVCASRFITHAQNAYRMHTVHRSSWDFLWPRRLAQMLRCKTHFQHLSSRCYTSLHVTAAVTCPPGLLLIHWWLGHHLSELEAGPGFGQRQGGRRTKTR